MTRFYKKEFDLDIGGKSGTKLELVSEDGEMFQRVSDWMDKVLRSVPQQKVNKKESV